MWPFPWVLELASHYWSGPGRNTILCTHIFKGKKHNENWQGVTHVPRRICEWQKPLRPLSLMWTKSDVNLPSSPQAQTGLTLSQSLSIAALLSTQLKRNARAYPSWSFKVFGVTLKSWATGGMIITYSHTCIVESSELETRNLPSEVNWQCRTAFQWPVFAFKTFPLDRFNTFSKETRQ